MTHCEVRNNGCGEYECDESQGGGVALSGGYAWITNTTFIGNVAVLAGGAVWVGESAVTVMQGCTFRGNYIHGHGAGGAISAEDGVCVTIRSSSFEENHAVSGGAAIGVSAGDPSSLAIYDLAARQQLWRNCRRPERPG